MPARPFDFSSLPHTTREQIALEATLHAYLGGRPYQPDFVDNMRAMLERYLRTPARLSSPELRTVSRGELASLLPAVPCLVVVGTGPGPHKILVELDMGVASFVIERLLGGSGETDRIQRPLTEIEEGVLSFMLLKVLGHFHDGLTTGRELGLTLERFASKLVDLEPVMGNETTYLMLGTRVGLGKHVGYARVLLPGSLVTEHFGKAVPQSGAGPEELAYMASRLDALGERSIIARCEMATIDLSPEDRAGLEKGDIIILENHQVQKTESVLTGLVFIKLGAGKNGGIRCRLLEGEQQRVEVVEIVVQEQPAEDAMANENESGAEGGENLAETEGLLRDVPAPVVVELGRLRMNTAQVVRLRKGQVLRLPRAPNDPVDLVVNGKLFARGELIEVDGELGVRLLQVVGPT